MIPKSHKFPLRTEFLRFRTRAKRTTTPSLNVYYLPHIPSEAKDGAGRLAVIVPKKLSKLATTRNWLRRLTYDTLWPQIKDRALDCVVVYKPLPLKKTTSTKTQLLTELNHLILNP